MIYAVLSSLYLTSVVASAGIKFFKETKLFKDVMDTGYKINLEKLSENNQHLSIYDKKISKITYFVPGFNIIGVLQSKKQYKEHYDTVVNYLEEMDCLVPLNDKEKKSYGNYPTASNAYLISADIDNGNMTYDFNYHKSASDKTKYIFPSQTEPNKKEELIELREYLNNQTTYDEDENIVLRKKH